MMSVTLLWWRYLSCRNQSIDLLCKSVDWFLRDRDLRHEKVNEGVSWFWYLVDYLTLPMWYLDLTVFQLRNSHTRARHTPTHRPYMHTINSSYFLNWHLSETVVVIWRYLNPLTGFFIHRTYCSYYAACDFARNKVPFYKIWYFFADFFVIVARF